MTHLENSGSHCQDAAVSAAGERSFAIDGRPAITPDCAAYFFDLTSVLARCEGLRRNPERMALMCRNHVRLLAPGELMIPRDTGFYLVMQTRTGDAADALAQEVSVTLLELFFGTDCFSDIASLFRPVTHGEMVEAGVGVSARPAPAAAVPPPGAPLARLGVAAAPAALSDLKFGFLPMLNIQSEGPAIHLCGVVSRREGGLVFGSAALKGCDPKVRPWLDAAALDYSLGLAQQIVPTRFAAAICTSVSFETLAWSRGRQLYQQALRSAGAANNPFLIVKIDDVPAGTPGARLAEMVAAVRPFVRRVFLHMPGDAAVPSYGGNYGAAGLCATLAPGASPQAVTRTAVQLVRAATIQRTITCLEGAEPSAIPLLRNAGIRFAAGSCHDGSLRLGSIFPDQAQDCAA